MACNDSDCALVIAGSLMFGFGGEKCTEIAFQNLGIDVCRIIPDHFSNNLEYPHKMAGKKLTADEVLEIYESLKANGLHKRFTILLTGYTGTAERIAKVGKIVKDLKETNPNLLYVCDPLIGDNNAKYIKEEDLSASYKKYFLPYSSIATPNQFETETLSGMKVNNQDDALIALQRIHDTGPNIVIMTSCKISDGDPRTQMIVGSQWKDGKREAYRIDFKYEDVYFVGAGDLFTGCFVGYFRQSNEFKTAFEKAISTMCHICQDTYNFAVARTEPGRKPSAELLEMRVVQCQSFLREPVITHTATKLI